jgi:hypothetical protein
MGDSDPYNGAVRDQVALIFALSACKRDGTSHQVVGMYVASTSDKANLGKHLATWRGKPFTPEEAKRFDLDSVVNVPCLLMLSEKPNADKSKVYTRIEAISKLPQGMQAPALDPRLTVPRWLLKLAQAGLQRKQQGSVPPQDDAPTPDDDSNLPF